MINRIVKMTFHENRIEDFLQVFRENAAAIRNQPGCHSVKLMQDVNQPNVFFTYSQWENEGFLNAYRQSETFGKVWPATKALFCAPANAWSISELAY